MKIELLDVGVGNVCSVRNWFSKLNVSLDIIDKPKKKQSDLLVLPGVGSVGMFMESIHSKKFKNYIDDHVLSGKRLIGICLGFQVMSKFSEEDGGVECLGYLDATVEKLPYGMNHNQWEPFYLDRRTMFPEDFKSKLSLSGKKIIDGRVFYNHEYGVVSDKKKYFNLSISDSLETYSSLIVSKNIIGIQFHPEKSQVTGLELLKIIL